MNWHKWIERVWFGKVQLVFIVFFIGVLGGVNSFAKVNNKTFRGGEVISYNAYYNWGFIWLNAGEVQFSVRDTFLNKVPCYFIEAIGKTHKTYDSFFKVRDTFQVFVNKDTLSTYHYRRATYEGPTNMQVEYSADFDSRKMYAKKWEPNQALRQDTFVWHANTYDVLSAIYAVRNFNFTGMKPGQTIPFKLWLDMEFYDIYVRYKGIEDVKIKDGRTFNCLVFSPLLVKGTLFTDGEGMKVYVTNDRNRIPVLIEAKILVGTVKAILENTKNLKYPMDAEIR